MLEEVKNIIYRTPFFQPFSIETVSKYVKQKEFHFISKKIHWMTCR